jgi:uncharacterized membrane protein YfcA
MHPLSLAMKFILVIGGLIGGFVDSIAGGGGLISLPLQSIAVGPGALAIGTNKIAGSVAAFVALLVYMRGGHVQWRRSFVFTILVGAGSYFGTRVSVSIPPALFRYLLLATCPAILWVVWRKDLWVARQIEEVKGIDLNFIQKYEIPFLFSGLACGFYDGAWGPGAGTFMFLSLLFIARMPLLASLATAKLANFSSGIVALVSYASRGYVEWLPGSLLAFGMIFGAMTGAHVASRGAVKAVRLVLVIVVVLLLIKLLSQSHALA